MAHTHIVMVAVVASFLAACANLPTWLRQAECEGTFSPSTDPASRGIDGPWYRVAFGCIPSATSPVSYD